MTQLSPHFSLAELTVRNKVPGADAEHVTADMRARLVRLAETLEVIRAEVGQPLHVTSGYRHGDPRQHGAGQAADVQVRTMSPLDLLRLIRRLSDEGRIRTRQVIAESLHVDPASLSRPMLEGSGLWVHVAIHGPGCEHASSRPWATSCAPRSGSRQYLPWSP